MLREVCKAAKDSYKDIDLAKGEAIIDFATYGSKDRDGDIANQGMFKKSWDEFKDVRFFENHDKLRAPGKILKLWDDAKQASTHVKFGTHTLGQDVLKQIDEGIITDASYVFVPQKAKQLPDGGYSYTEVFHKEVSALTHWGAHPESKIKTVRKEWESIIVGSEILKELSTDEVQRLKNFIATYTGTLQDMVNFASTLQQGSDLYTRIHDFISTVNNEINSFKYTLKWYGPQIKSDTTELYQRLAKIKSFCNNTTASDECIKEVLKEAVAIETILSREADGTQSSTSSTQEQQKGMSSDSEVNLHLLNLSMLFDK